MTEKLPFIPFNRPFIVGKELFHISQAVIGGQLAGGGQFTERCHLWLEQRFRIHKALLTHSCTAALEMAAMLVDVKPGDEVILPSYTFVSTANAFALRGARLRFVDIRSDTLNIDETMIERAITARTRAIVPVHYAGVAAEMDTIMAIASKHGLTVIEDAAQGVGAHYRGRWLGGIGDLGAFSFHETKNVIAGEGGALCVNRPQDLERAQVIREKGTDRTRFLRGETDKYTWVDLGSSFLPSELTAAFLYAQLEEIETINRQRRQIHGRYVDAFREPADSGKLRLPHVPKHCDHNAHMFYLILPSRAQRDGLIAHLAQHNIQAVFHYVPLHSSPMGRQLSAADEVLPVTDNMAGRLVRLPCYYELSPEEQDRVIDATLDFVDERATRRSA